MNLGELQALVLRTVKRPELAAQAVDAINAAIEYACADGDYAWDLTEGSVDIDGSAAAQSLVIADNFPRFRSIKYLKPQGYTKFLDWVDPKKTFVTRRNGGGQCAVTNCWYRAGTNIVFSLSNLQTVMLYGYYPYPDLLVESDDENDYTVNMPFAIAWLAVGIIFDGNGNDAESARYEKRGIALLHRHKSTQDGITR